ncbi:LacI family DNA-binding transcriptional regulator [Amycolatopsis alkalitolerans]|uniref:LacI family transcriptional regulator n=1 Tax=Amycolatopsis alkalitolerans TaxID=2547244 RepID=A0A5C4M3P3_9PSEU|nr:LacI family DNA-binding transcriptional regulator [Amycolatopsis alkalitolerans]TNC25735.1 LacI family transcriptional regulator [Amycolatopsis alkalitolerans]
MAERSRRRQGGRRTVSIRDVAEAAGVSVATVSRALSADSASFHIRPETRQHVLETSAALGYRPNDLARALLQQRTSVIGVVVPDISNPFYPDVVRGIEDVASAAGYRMILCNTDREPDRLNKYLETLVSSRVDGVLIAGGAADTPIDVDIFARYHTKVVVVGRHDVECPSVQLDNVAAGAAITAHLAGLGHRRIALIAGPEGSRTMRDRFEGYRTALREHGLPFDEALVGRGELDEAAGYRVAGELTTMDNPPTGIVTVNDRMAVGALAALHDQGIAVPHQVSVTGFDDVSFASYVRPKLTTVAVPTYRVGTTAAELLISSLRGEVERTTSEPVVLPTEVIIRDSCAPPPA